MHIHSPNQDIKKAVQAVRGDILDFARPLKMVPKAPRQSLLCGNVAECEFLSCIDVPRKETSLILPGPRRWSSRLLSVPTVWERS